MPRRAASPLTAAAVDRALRHPPASGRAEWFDAASPGLCLRVTAAGAASWTFKYRDAASRRTERLRLGDAGRGGLSLAQARAAADRCRADRNAGANPAKDRRERSAIPTFEVAACRYLDHLAALGRPSLRNDRSNLVRPRRRWGRLPVDAIDRRMIVELVEEIGKAYPRTGNATLTTLKGLFGWMVDRAGLLRDSPAAGIPVLFRTAARERILSPDEIRGLWQATGDGRFNPRLSAVLRLLLLTGQRSQQIRAIHRGEILDLAGDSPRLAWPPERMKSRRRHALPLAPEARAIVAEAMRATNSEKLFGVGQRSIILAAQALNGGAASAWTPHDLRRTAVTLMAEIGVPESLRSLILAHGATSLRSVYDRHERHAEMLEALARLEAHIGRIVL